MKLPRSNDPFRLTVFEWAQVAVTVWLGALGLFQTLELFWWIW